MADTALDVIELARSMMNDPSKDPDTGDPISPGIYTDVMMLPLANSAYRRFQKDLATRGIAHLKGVVTITLPAGGTRLDTTGVAPNAALPSDFVHPYELWERPTSNTTMRPQQLYGPVPRLPDRDPTLRLSEFEYTAGAIQFIRALQSVDIELRYEKAFPKLATTASPILINSALDALAARTATLASRARGVKQLAADMRTAYQEELEIWTAEYWRPKQRTPVRRRPYGARRRVIFM